MDMSPTTMMGMSSITMVIMVVTMMVVSCGATDTGRRHPRRSANVRMLEGRRSVVQRRFGPFTASTTHGTMRHGSPEKIKRTGFDALRQGHVRRSD
jgi:hypothetical protein